ncbi:Cytochrome P450 94C1 [Phytophthora citrophthora]|uniref:Cytochrome P450 94C1 n=1 Tax=Phytophthora citrophthora TaxID=4793 RepID=A0AAD9LP31_9STRA|nr:Cytochrome P450 94C1 [Phytophthora citrophthora]
MMPSSLLNVRGLVAISPGPLLGSTLALVVLWAMRRGRERRLSWTSTPLPPQGYRHLPSTSTAYTPVRVGMTAEQPKEGSPAFYDWVFAMTVRFHGKPWVLHRPGQPDVLIVSSPGSFEDIQRTFAMQFDKIDSDAEGLSHDVHGGAIALVGSGSLRPSVNTQRQLAVNVLSSPALRQQASTLVKHKLEPLVAKLDDSLDSLDVTKLMRQFAMEVFTELGFGLQLRSSNGDSSLFEKAVDDIQMRVAERMQRSTVAWKLERLLDVGCEAALRRSIEIVNAITLGAVEAKKKRSSDSPVTGSRVDMLDLLLSQKCSSKTSKDPEFLAEFVLSLVLAARDSMAHALSKCLQCLAQYPDEQEKLALELKDAEEQGKDVHSVVRLEAVVKETLRLFPAKPFVRRRARLDTVLSDGTFVAAGVEVAMDLYTMARRGTVWGTDSTQFRPQRWIDSTTGRLRPVSNYKFNSFLGGPRACVGAEITLTEIKKIVAAVTLKIQLEIDDSYHKDEGCEAVHVRVRRRSPSPTAKLA